MRGEREQVSWEREQVRGAHLHEEEVGGVGVRRTHELHLACREQRGREEEEAAEGGVWGVGGGRGQEKEVSISPTYWKLGRKRRETGAGGRGGDSKAEKRERARASGCKRVVGGA